MKRLRLLVVLGVVLVVSLIAGAYAAGQDAPALSAGDAREFTVRAFTASGFNSVEVTGEPRAEVAVIQEVEGQGEEGPGEEGEEDRDGSGDSVPVWVVPASVADQQVELYVARSEGRAVLLDDALPGGGFVLNDEQFDRLEAFRLDLASERLREDRQGPAVVAGLLIVLAVLLLIVAAFRGRRRGEAPPEESQADPQPAVG